MEKYDLVVFMDDDNPKKTPQGDYLPPANHLMKGLTIVSFETGKEKTSFYYDFSMLITID